MTKLRKLHFLVHGLCYAEMTNGQPPGSEMRTRFAAYIQRENNCEARWRAAIEAMPRDEGLAIVPAGTASDGPAARLSSFAAEVLGGRCFVLDCPDGSEARFWTDGDTEFRESILEELQGAFVTQRLEGNPEEFDTDFHCLACSARLRALLRERGLEIDASTAADGWGASFEGCVLKYTATFRRMLGLVAPIDIDFSMTVPDAAFLVDIADSESVYLRDGLRLFLLRSGDDAIALYTTTSQALSDGPVQVQLPLVLKGVAVRNKQGTRLWPDGEANDLASAPLKYREPAQGLVHATADGIVVPACAGFVYRLAKAPAFVFAPPGMSYQSFRDECLTALIVNTGDL